MFTSQGFKHNSLVKEFFKLHYSSIMSSGPKGKRRELDLKKRYEVVRLKEKNPHVSARRLADQFKCGKTQIQAILLEKDEISKDYESNVNGNIKRVRGSQHEEIDKALLDWF